MKKDKSRSAAQQARAASAKRKPIPISFRSAPTVVLLAILAGLAVAAYVNGLHGEFVFDDQQIVFQNPDVVNVRNLGDVLKLAYGSRQLLFLSYGLNYYWTGTDTYSYHVVNLALHIVNVILVYFIILEIVGAKFTEGGRYAAFTGAAVFSVHPLMGSAVSYIAGRSSVLCAIFYFSALLAFMRALRPGTRTRVRLTFFVVTGALGLLAWLVKQEAIAIPALLAGVVWLKSEKKHLKYVAALAVLPLVAAFAMRRQLSELYASVMSNAVLVNAGFDKVLPPGTYFRTYVKSIVYYFFPRFIFPADLNADPYVPPVAHWYSPEFLISLAVLGLAAWPIVRTRKTDPLLAYGLAALLLSPLTAYAFIPLADVVLEHRAYIPGLGIAILAAFAFQWIGARYPMARVIAPLATVVALAATTIGRNAVFADNITLWQDVVRKSPEKARAYFNLGAAYQNAHRSNDAIPEYRKALELKPDMYAAYSNLAAMELDSGNLDASEQTLLDVTRRAPDYTEGFINLGVLYLRKHDPDKALAALNRALELNPRSYPAYFNKGEALTQKGDNAAAVENYKKAVGLRPDLTSFQLSLGAAYVRAGDIAAAQTIFDGLANSDVAPEADRNLATISLNKGDSDKAIQYLNDALRLKPVFPEAHHDLGVIDFKAKNYDDAIKEFKTTLQEQPDYGPAVLNLALAEQMKGDLAAARTTLQEYLQRFEGTGSPYVVQVRSRLDALK